MGDEITLIEIVSDSNVTVLSCKPNSNSFSDPAIELSPGVPEAGLEPETQRVVLAS